MNKLSIRTHTTIYLLLLVHRTTETKGQVNDAIFTFLSSSFFSPSLFPSNRMTREKEEKKRVKSSTSVV